MMNIKEYLNNILNNQGFEAWEAENENLWNMYCEEEEEENGIFTSYCEERGVNLEARTASGTLVVVHWMWDNEE